MPVDSRQGQGRMQAKATRQPSRRLDVGRSWTPAEEGKGCEDEPRKHNRHGQVTGHDRLRRQSFPTCESGTQFPSMREMDSGDHDLS